MKENKRTRVRGIIFIDGKLVSMYREFQDRVFYTFPGGGLEGNETEEYLNQWKSDVEYERTRLIRDDYYINWILYESDTHQKRGGKKYGCQRTNKK